ncbi:MAG: hypothetical protein ABL986_18280 [Vicinamibacterales bacterium]
MPHCFLRLVVPALVVLCLASAPPTSAQTAAATQNVEVSPIDCYWRTSTDAVRVGEPFTLFLTCSVLDTAATTVLPDQSRLDPGVLQLQPFEVSGGRQAPDLRTSTRRFFQYEYQLRYVGEEVGRDLQLPALTLTYRVQSRVRQDDAAVESRERQYILPAHTIRILSIVPQLARDIRDAPPVTLAEIDARHFRASILRIVSWALYAVGVVVAAWGLLSAFRRRRARSTVVVRHTSDAAVLSAVLKELSDVRRASAAGGWTDTLAARALTALRIGASYGTAAHVVQTPAVNGVTPLSGQLRVSGRWLSGATVLVSGASTAGAIASHLRSATRLTSTQTTRLEELQSALTRFAQVSYGRGLPASLEDLDDALASGERAVNAIRREHSWLALQLRALRQWTGDSVKARGWARS